MIQIRLLARIEDALVEDLVLRHATTEILGSGGAEDIGVDQLAPQLFQLVRRQPMGRRMTPHIGNATLDQREWMEQAAIDNVLAYFEGRPLSNLIAECR